MTEQNEAAQETGGETLAAVLEKKNEQIPHEVTGSEKLEHSRIRYIVKVPAEVFDDRVEEVLGEFSREVAIPGFRKGKAPVKLIRNRFGKNAKDEAVRKMVPRLAEIVAEEDKKEALGQPVFEGWDADDDGAPLIKIILEVRPEIALSEETLKDLSVEVTTNPVTDQRVDQEIEALRQRNAYFEAKEGASYEPGDAVSLDMNARDDQDRSIGVYTRNNDYVEDLEEIVPAQVVEALTGKTKGEEVTIDGVEIPAGEEGETVQSTFTITLHEVKKRVVPELDDEFAKDVSADFETVADLRDTIRKELESQETENERRESLSKIYAILGERLNFDLPPTLVYQIQNQSIHRMEQQLNQYGMSLNRLGREHVRAYVDRAEQEARGEAKNLLLADELGRFWNIEADDEVLQKELERIAEIQGRKPLAVRAALEAQNRLENFKAEIRVKLVNDKLLESAEIKKVEAKPEAEAESASE